MRALQRPFAARGILRRIFLVSVRHATELKDRDLSMEATMNHRNARQRIPAPTFAEGLWRILVFGGGLLAPLLCPGSLAAAGEGSVPDSIWIVVAGQPGTIRQSVKPGESNVWLQDKPPATGLADGNATTAARFKDIGKLAACRT